MFVDDSPNSLKLMIDTVLDSLPELDFITAVNGKSAVEIAKKELPNLILMDWQMPEMSGIEAVIEIRKDKNFEEIKMLERIKKELFKYECHQAKAIFKILNTIPDNSSEFLSDWKNKISNCVYTGNNEEFTKFIND